MRAPAVALCALLLCACGKKDRPEKARPDAAPAAPSVPPAASAAPLSESWTGTYVAKIALIDQPAGTKGVASADDAGKLATGPGTFLLSVTRGRVMGEGKGALGPLVLSGVLDGRALRIALLPTDPNAPQAMTGWMLATIDAGKASAARGTLRVSSGDARLVREASVELERAR